MLPQILIASGAAVLSLLGMLHIVYTFFTNKLEPRDGAVTAAMKTTSPVLTKRTSMWNGRIGFNGSHSLGILLFAVTYLVLAIGHMLWRRDSPTLTWLPIAGCAAYLSLGRYWFRTPVIGLLRFARSF